MSSIFWGKTKTFFRCFFAGELTKSAICYKVFSMSYIFFDLEWNQGYPHSVEDKLDEIIQIGACRLEQWDSRQESFSSYVRPAIHKKLHHRVRKMLPLDMTTLKRAEGFRTVARKFFQWCGSDPIFFTWGNSDIRVLDMNLCWYGMEEYLELEIYDLQRAFDLMVLHTDQQAALKDAVETLGLGEDREYHDAGNDAFYTALIGAELVRRYGKLPTQEELGQMEAALRRERRLQAAQAANLRLQEILSQDTPIYHRSFGLYKTVDECLSSKSARVIRCPKCDSWLCNGSWLKVDQHYIARSRCLEHGRFYTCVTIHQGSLGARGNMDLFPPESFSPELYRMCKLGGKSISMGKLVRKHTRTRKRKRKVKPKLGSES